MNKFLSSFLYGGSHKCFTCGKRMEVVKATWKGTYYKCVDEKDEIHIRHKEMYDRWVQKIQELESTLNDEDLSLAINHDRECYGRIKIDIKRTKTQRYLNNEDW